MDTSVYYIDMKNTENELTEFNLMGYNVVLKKDAVKIYNLKNLPTEEFKVISDRIVRYLIDEAFIEKKSRIRVEIVSAPTT